ncbi:MAG TPA: class I tRNA ligase family protein, partial [Candidatus Binataceae bacterium]|nr:class I tRNA ligase family protein [Candidatus Binataceae bacterium]
FSTMGWPDDTPELQFYYPTSLLVTGFDIIFFWVARMMMFGLKCMNRGVVEESVPFRHVYITPLVRDQYGKKMTKSRGNVVDPLEIMERYGTDAVRFTLAQMAIQGRDLILSDDRLAASRAFANKIWNAARFVLMNLEGAPQPLPAIDRAQLSLADRWILSRLDGAIRGVTNAIDAYEFNNAALVVYQFIWHEFCDWYIELAKDPLKAGGERQTAARYVLVTAFDKLLRILHPFMPFISEEIWQVLKPFFPEPPDREHLAVATFPIASEIAYLTESEAVSMQHCIEATQAINSLRALAGYHPGQRVAAVVRANSLTDRAELDSWQRYAITLGKLTDLRAFLNGDSQPQRAIFAPLEWGEVGVEPPEKFDFDKVRSMLKKKLDEVSGHLERHRSRYENAGFRAKADAETVADIAERIQELQSQQRTLETQITQLG